jgi:GH15 family glucan-1,4-alpha-glucosidase
MDYRARPDRADPGGWWLAAMTTPIKDYALIGNCETAALINPSGGIDWLCLPAFDSPSIFAALLDENKGGTWTVRPVGSFEVEREYLEESAIFVTRFITATGVVRLTDFFVVARKASARFYDFTSLHHTRKLVRLIELERGSSVEMEVVIQAQPNYAREAPAWKENGDGNFDSREAAIFTNAPLTHGGDSLSGKFRAEPGVLIFLVLDYGEVRQRPDLPEIRRWQAITTAFWREWNLFNYYKGPHERLVRRSAVTLKLLTYAQTGAFVAAPTTSLPEILGGDANWDYRFTWVRDTSLFIQTLFGLGYSGEAKAFLDFAVKKWMKRSEEMRGDLEGITAEVLYPIGDAPLAPEESLLHLSGYKESRPVRIGNAAGEQFQLDNYGHLFQALFFFQHTGGQIDGDKKKMMQRLAEEASRFWKKEDNGIWEVRETHPFTYGKIMCWVALQRARDLLGDEDGAMEKVCEEIRAEILDRGVVDDDGRKILSALLDEKSLDVSALLAFTTGFLPEHLAASTRKSVERALGVGPLIYRSEKNRGQEGAFLICTFWWINHLLQEGRLHRAEELVEQVIKLASPLGLYSEEIEPTTGEFLGNFPQAFSHLGLIQSILNIESAKKIRGFYALADHEKFKRCVGTTVGGKAVVAGFFRVPKTILLLFSRASKWRE